MKVGEAVSAAALSALVFIILIYAIPDCKAIHGLNKSMADNLTSGDLGDVNATTPSSSSSWTVENSTVNDDVTRGTQVITNVSTQDVIEHERDAYGYHGGHGYVFQVEIKYH